MYVCGFNVPKALATKALKNGFGPKPLISTIHNLTGLEFPQLLGAGERGQMPCPASGHLQSLSHPATLAATMCPFAQKCQAHHIPTHTLKVPHL